jgi:hypothetical protein
MKKILYFLLALLFPWFIFFMDEKFGKALVALMLQASVIGWIFATVWAWRVAKESFVEEKQIESVEQTKS